MKKLTLFIALLIPVFTFSQIINIPEDYPTIQEGIDAAINGDTVLVDTGTHFENINFIGKAITVASKYIMDGDTNHINNTVINGSQQDTASVVTLNSGEDTTSVLYGFTITGGTGLFVEEFDMILGGGIATNSAGVKIIHNKIIDNEIDHSGYAGGGGIGCLSEDEENWLVARDNVISGNNCYSDGIEAYGGGIFAGTNLILEDNEVFENTCTGINSAEANGGGILLGSQSRTLIFNICDNFIHDNTCDGNTVVGAGLILWFSEGTVSGNEISYNTGLADNTAQGGGMNLHSAIGTTNIIDNDFIGNNLEAYHVQGGGLQLALANDIVTIENNSFESNTIIGTDQVKGGGIIIIQNQEVSINNNLFYNNILQGGANLGAGVFGSNPVAKTEIMNNTFTLNTTLDGGYGGGIAFFDSGNPELEISGNIFENNSSGAGGGVYTYNCYNMLLSNNLFNGNDASELGGGCRFRHSSKGSFGLLSNEDYNYLDPSEPIQNRKDITHPFLINNTFVNNLSNYGGAVYSDHEDEFPHIINSIFWENEAIDGNDIYNVSTLDSILVSYCNVNEENIFGSWYGIGNIDDDPMFVGLGDHPYQINDYSPCIDNGTPDITGLNLPEYDLAGEVRIFNDRVDMGAYEWNTFVGMNEPIILTSNLKVQLYPNPFSTSTTIAFELQQPSTVQITIYNHLGKQIEIIQQNQTKGKQRVSWDATGLPSGVYFCVLETNDGIQTTKLIKIK